MNQNVNLHLNPLGVVVWVEGSRNRSETLGEKIYFEGAVKSFKDESFLIMVSGNNMNTAKGGEPVIKGGGKVSVEGEEIGHLWRNYYLVGKVFLTHDGSLVGVLKEPLEKSENDEYFDLGKTFWDNLSVGKTVAVENRNWFIRKKTVYRKALFKGGHTRGVSQFNELRWGSVVALLVLLAFTYLLCAVMFQSFFVAGEKVVESRKFHQFYGVSQKIKTTSSRGTEVAMSSLLTFSGKKTVTHFFGKDKTSTGRKYSFYGLFGYSEWDEEFFGPNPFINEFWSNGGSWGQYRIFVRFGENEKSHVFQTYVESDEEFSPEGVELLIGDFLKYGNASMARFDWGDRRLYETSPDESFVAYEEWREKIYYFARGSLSFCSTESGTGCDNSSLEVEIPNNQNLRLMVRVKSRANVRDDYLNGLDVNDSRIYERAYKAVADSSWRKFHISVSHYSDEVDVSTETSYVDNKPVRLDICYRVHTPGFQRKIEFAVPVYSAMTLPEEWKSGPYLDLETKKIVGEYSEARGDRQEVVDLINGNAGEESNFFDYFTFLSEKHRTGGELNVRGLAEEQVRD